MLYWLLFFRLAIYFYLYIEGNMHPTIYHILTMNATFLDTAASVIN